MQNPVIILGAKQLGIVALDIFKSHDILVYCFLDDDKTLHNTEVNDITVMSDTEDSSILKSLGKKSEAFVAAEDQAHRRHLLTLLRDEYQVMPVNAVHKSALISEDAVLGHGNLLAAGCILGPGAKIGNLCVLHARAVVDSLAMLGDNVQVGAGAVVNSGVSVGNNAFIGSGAILVSGITVGKNARIGAGSVVIADVADGQTIFGNPAAAVSR